MLRRGGVVCPAEDRFLASDPSRPPCCSPSGRARPACPSRPSPLGVPGAPERAGRAPEGTGASGHRVFLAGSTPACATAWTRCSGTTRAAKGRRHQRRPPQPAPPHRGRVLKEPKLLVLTEREVFGRRAAGQAEQAGRAAAFMSDLRDLKPRRRGGGT